MLNNCNAPCKFIYISTLSFSIYYYYHLGQNAHCFFFTTTLKNIVKKMLDKNIKRPTYPKNTLDTSFEKKIPNNPTKLPLSIPFKPSLDVLPTTR